MFPRDSGRERGPDQRLRASIDPGLLRELEASLDGEAFTVAQRWTGYNAHAYRLVLPRSGRQLVLKVVHRESQVEYEAEVYRRAAALAPEEARLFPRLHAAFLEHEALLIDHVPGISAIRAAAARRDLRPVAANMRAALAVFHERFGVPFTDFHFHNVLVRPDDRVVLINSGEPRPTDVSLTLWDMSYWIYCAAIWPPWRAVVGPRTAIGVARLTLALTTEVLCQPGAKITVDELEAAALRRLRSRWRAWPRDKVVFLSAYPATRLLFYMVRRRLRNLARES